MSALERRPSALGILDARWTSTNLELPRGLPFETWQEIVVWLAHRESAIQWAIGDAIVYGEDEYGESYAQIEAVLEAAGFSPPRRQTLLNYAWTSKHVPPSRRREDLQYSHHVEVAALSDRPDEQEELLGFAAERDWSVRRLRREVHRPRAIRTDAPHTTDRYRLLHADVAADLDRVAADVGTVDVIVTDPPYGEKHLHLYSALSALAARTLRPGGCAFVLVGQAHLPQYLDELRRNLTYLWDLAYLTPGQSAQVWQRPFVSQHKLVLAFVNGAATEYNGPEYIADVLTSPAREKDAHEWQQSEDGMLALVSRVARPGEVVFDPFVGSGSTGVAALRHGCSFTGIDCDDARALPHARARLAAELADEEAA